MDENACLNELCSSKGARRIVVSAWEAQITDALVWNTCCEAVATGDDARLHRWRTAIAIAQNALHPQDVSAASAFLDCAKLTLKAKALGDEKNPARQTHTAEDTRIALLHAAMQVLGLACHCDVDHGQLWTSSMTQRIFGQGDAVDEAGSMVAEEALAIRAVDSVLAFLAARETRAEFPVTVSWVWDVTRALLKKPRRIVCSRTVPVAGTDTHGGFLAEFVLEVLEPGCGGDTRRPVTLQPSPPRLCTQTALGRMAVTSSCRVCE